MIQLEQLPRKKRYARASALFGGLIAGLGILIASWAYMNPLEWAEMKSRYQFRHDTGATSSEINGLTAFQHLEPPSQHLRTCWLFIHGMGDSLVTWKKLIPLLARDQSWIAVDLPGQGGNRKEIDAEKYRVSQTAERIYSGLKADDLIRKTCEQYRVVANSFGGWIALKMALDHPAGIYQLFLLGGVGIQKPALPSLPIFTEPTVEALKDFQSKAYFKPRELPDSIWQAATERAKKGESGRIRASQTVDEYLDGKLSLLRVETLSIHGEADRIVPLDYAQALVSQIRGAKLEKISECGHMPQKECPERLKAVIASYLEERGKRGLSP